MPLKIGDRVARKGSANVGTVVDVPLYSVVVIEYDSHSRYFNDRLKERTVTTYSWDVRPALPVQEIVNAKYMQMDGTPTVEFRPLRYP